MAEGDMITLNDIVFRETAHGPLVTSACEICGVTVYEEGERVYGTKRRDPPYTLCVGCLRRRWGLP